MKECTSLNINHGEIQNHPHIASAGLQSGLSCAEDADGVEKYGELLNAHRTGLAGTSAGGVPPSQSYVPSLLSAESHLLPVSPREKTSMWPYHELEVALCIPGVSQSTPRLL